MRKQKAKPKQELLDLFLLLDYDLIAQFFKKGVQSVINIRDVIRSGRMLSFTILPHPLSDTGDTGFEAMLFHESNRSRVVIRSRNSNNVTELLEMDGALNEILDFLFQGLQIYSLYSCVLNNTRTEILVMHKPASMDRFSR